MELHNHSQFLNVLVIFLIISCSIPNYSDINPKKTSNKINFLSLINIIYDFSPMFEGLQCIIT